MAECCLCVWEKKDVKKLRKCETRNNNRGRHGYTGEMGILKREKGKSNVTAATAMTWRNYEIEQSKSRGFFLDSQISLVGSWL